MMPKAIETIYQGWRFRSRLEARWAVWLDTAGVEYLYEPEGFELADHPYWRYLPDFWLPKSECWVEIKPAIPEGDDEIKQLLFGVVHRQRLLCLAGQPWPRCWFGRFLHGSKSSPVFHIAPVSYCPGALEAYPVLCSEIDRLPEVAAAYRAARGARFERPR